MNVVLDTCVVSELVARAPEAQVLGWLDALDPRTVYLSVITIGEIQRGIARLPSSRRRATLESWLDDDLVPRFDGQILAIDTAVMRTWGIVVAGAEAGGRTLPVMDGLIPATAITHRCQLATHNGKDFEATGVSIVDPWAGGA